MAQSTRLGIITDGLALAGRDELSTLAQQWLQRWLDAVAASWDWPMLRKEHLGLAVTTAYSAATGQTFGNGTGPTNKVLKILNPVTISDNQYGLTVIPIINNRSVPSDRVQAVGQSRGTPSQLRLAQTEFGVWKLYLNNVPDKTYYLNVPYKELPAALDDDNDIPWYPNDETMIQLVRFKALEFADAGSPDMTIAQQQLAGLLSNDRVRYGQLDDVSDGGPLGMLDRNVFKNHLLKR